MALTNYKYFQCIFAVWKVLEGLQNISRFLRFMRFKTNISIELDSTNFARFSIESLQRNQSNFEFAFECVLWYKNDPHNHYSQRHAHLYVSVFENLKNFSIYNLKYKTLFILLFFMHSIFEFSLQTQKFKVNFFQELFDKQHYNYLEPCSRFMHCLHRLELICKITLKPYAKLDADELIGLILITNNTIESKCIDFFLKSLTFKNRLLIENFQVNTYDILFLYSELLNNCKRCFYGWRRMLTTWELSIVRCVICILAEFDRFVL